MTEPSKLTKLNFALLLGSLLIGILFNYLFYDKTVGISFPIFWIVLYVFFYFIFQDKLKFEKTFGWFLTIPNLLLIFTFLIFSSEDFWILNAMLVIILFIVQSILLTKNNKNPWYKLSFLWESFRKSMESMSNILVPFKIIGEWVRTKSNKTAYGVVGKVIIGVLFSLPLIGIILMLLTSADSIFSHWMNEIPNVLGEIDLGDIPFQIFLISVISFAIFSYFWSLKHPFEEPELLSLKTEKKPFHIDGIITLTILFLINVVYILFTAIQVSYLFGAAKRLLPKGVTYAEYATKGFYELVTVTTLNIFIVILVIYLVQKTQPAIYRIVQILLSLLTTCTAFILVSAFQKLSLYEEVYGYTYTRILVHAFMILLLLLFVVAMIKTWKNTISLMQVYVIVFLVWYVGLNYINIDHIIAKQNVERYFATEQIEKKPLTIGASYDRDGYNEYIDLFYLNSLSYDAVPQLIKLRKDPKLKSIIDKELQIIEKRLNQESDWQSFNFSKYQAEQLIKNAK
ncbi:DUF4153 domain-containing protein [Shimazuella kribbensis]|uniref:DUF4153 domain-containing protein n=1 Tax=Shimazuella kribbensis TaxID=139808 RepID=UPI000418AE52|nr:DUF4173 domain-containing protein [Shimazuella kribbensis]